MQTWGGPWFFMQAQKGGSNNLVHVIKGGPLSFMQRCWGQNEAERTNASIGEALVDGTSLKEVGILQTF